MSIFTGDGVEQSSEAELATLTKDNPELTQEPAPEAAPEPPAPEPEAARPEPQVEQRQPDPEPKTVPLAALTEERAARRALETQLAELRGRLDQIGHQAQPQQQQQQDPEPNPDEDPIAHMHWQKREIANLRQTMGAMALERRVSDDYQADVRRFMSTQNDFGQAYDHLLASRVGELRAQGYTDAQIMPHVRREEMGIALAALQQNKSPAQAIYDLAKARGYAPKAPEAPKPVAPPPVDPALQEARAKAAVSLSEGGKAPKSDLSLEDIANLRGAAQEAALKKWEERNVGRQSIFRE